jgi:hypothetical protein
MRTRVRGWRWRRNPLRRRSDVVEAWTALAVAVLLLVGAPLAGALAGLWAHRTAQAVAEERRAERHQVHAEVVGRPPVRRPDRRRPGPRRQCAGRGRPRVVRRPGPFRRPAARWDRRVAAHRRDRRGDRGGLGGRRPARPRHRAPCRPAAPDGRMGARLDPHQAGLDPQKRLTPLTGLTVPHGPAAPRPPLLLPLGHFPSEVTRSPSGDPDPHPCPPDRDRPPVPPCDQRVRAARCSLPVVPRWR